MDLDSLYLLVTDAITRADYLSTLGSPSAASAHLDVSLIEEQIAALLPPSNPEGEVARRGAVRAAVSGGELDRARALAQRYLSEPDVSQETLDSIEDLLHADEDDDQTHSIHDTPSWRGSRYSTATRHMALTVVSAGADREGIVARITQILSDRGYVIEDMTGRPLAGHWTITIIVSRENVPWDYDPRELELALAEATTDLRFALWPVAHALPSPSTGFKTRVLIGATAPHSSQMISALAALLGDLNLNIEHIELRRTDSPASDEDVVVMLATLPESVDFDAVKDAVRSFGRERNVFTKCVLAPEYRDIMSDIAGQFRSLS